MPGEKRPKARANQTETAVLGALSVEPMTGYALRVAIRDVLGHFWSESFGQIYPTLAALERDGHVRRRDTTRPRASTFEITPSGTARLHELLAQPVQPVPPRNGLMLRLFFGRHLGAPACRALILDARARAERDLAEYHEIRRQLSTEPDPAGDRLYWALTVSAGEHTAHATIAWADEALADLDRLDQPPPDPAAPAASTPARGQTTQRRTP
jgi:DNA-binding PadR family transcriptional regulator